MKSNLKLYKVEFKPELNPLVENLESYLADCDKTTYGDFQYIKHDLNIVVKIPMSQEFVDEFPFNYAAIKNSDSDDTFYYYVMDINWVAQNTIALTLGMDTVNTLGQPGSLGHPSMFTDETHIYRQHGDRFYDTGQRDQAGGKLLRRRIDREDEGFTVAKEQVSSAIASDKNFRDNQNWALMYKTASEPDAAGPLGIYLVPTFECKAQSAQTEGSVAKTPADFSAGSWYYFLPTENPGGRVVINYDNWIDDIGNILNIDWFGQVGAAAVELTDDTYFQFSQTSNGLDMTVYKRDGSYWDLDTTYKNIRLIGFTKGTQLRYGYSTQATKSPAVITANTPYTIPLQADTEFTRIKTLQEIDHYDSKIAKIIKLPYCPLDVAFRNNEITLPFGWELEGDLIKWSEPGLPTLYRPAAASFTLNLVDYWYPSIKQSKDAGRESKLFHSEFMDWNVVYDSFVKSIALERFDLSETDPGRITVDYQQTNTLGNNMLFKVNFNHLAPYKTIENFEEYLLVDRNNEDPIFTSNYLDYLRSGYQYDVAANKLAEKRARAEAVQSTGAAIAQLATAGGVSYTPNKTTVAPAGSPMGAWVGWEIDGGHAINPRAVGSGRGFKTDTKLTLPGSGGVSVKGSEGLVNQVAYGSLYNAANSWTNYSNLLKTQKLQMNAKLTDLQMQSIGVSGSGTIDLLESYCGNKINVVRYEPRLTIKRRLYDFFDYFGYSHDYYEVPNVNSRYWYNFIQCSPMLVEEGLGKYKEVWLEDLKARYETGITVFHKQNDEWNFDRRWENWETWVITE